MHSTEKEGKGIKNLQGLRFIAFLLVFLNHSFWLLEIKKVFDFGARGVEIFLVLSGYLIAFNYSNKEFDTSIKACFLYAYHKVKKFYFLHFLTFLYFLYSPLMKAIRGGLVPTEQRTLLINGILNITLLKSWYFPSAFSFNGVSWFLSTIIFSYFFVPKIVMFFKTKSKAFCMLFFCSLLSMKLVLDTFGYKFSHSFHAFSLYTNPAYRFQDFLLGYIFYLSVKDVIGEKTSTIIRIIQVCLPLIYMASISLIDWKWIPAQYILLTCLLILMTSMPNRIYNAILGNRVITLLGDCTFEMFILHNLIIKNIIQLCKSLGFQPKITAWIFSLGITILISILIHEKPWKNKYRSKLNECKNTSSNT